ncbi:hypothetical protein BDV95DRAFT_500755 [Massariosphaeria phaeospora]|uniref:Uncharacterized protein n=1 Tax=Massariosphaeria phaeospora TaxID=100035 RepID=A0A7C8M5W7_9PLEO|nr:hypothetical protein BDV95DRAFT_500755 [Massariosphaeria phaeospora]
MHQCSALIRVAAPLGCIPLLRPHIDSHLAQYRQELFTAITDDPPSFLLLGMALQNRSIYTECMVHVCGAWPAWPFKTKIKQMMKPQDPLHLLIEKKTVERDAAILQTENDLMLITIHIPDGTMRRPVKCTDQAWLETWVIVQVFHDHLTYALRTLAFDKKASLKRGVLFRTIHKGVNAYMEYEYARDLCKKIMPLGFKREFGQDLKNLKEHAALITRHLAKNELMIDPDQHDLGYLTCTKIEDADIIWNME